MISMIHPSAIIDHRAQLDTQVTIGPYVIIGANVKISKGTIVGSHSVIDGDTCIGTNNNIAAFTSIGGAPQDIKYCQEQTKLEIGNDNTIREFTTINIGTIQDNGVTKIGNKNWIMSYVHIAHDCQIGNNTIIANNVQLCGHVFIGDWAVLGGMSGVHQFVRIGAHAMLGGASALRQDIPPFVIAAGDGAAPYGINIKGLRRRGFNDEIINSLKKVYRLLYKSSYGFEQAKQMIVNLIAEYKNEIKTNEVKNNTTDKINEMQLVHVYLQNFLDFICNSKRGIAR